jgi:biopolymer transport protein TolQ
MDAFLSIAQQGNATLTTVAPPIAEALIATAIGLVAAIPAVIGYNAFYNQIKYLDIEIDTFSNDFLNIIKRHLS